jgi:hypothetical protein
LGIRNTLRPLRGAGHIPFESSAAYADTTFRTMRDFLRPVLALPGLIVTAAQAPAPAAPAAQAYPNPADDAIRIELPAAWVVPGRATAAEAQLLDAAGRVVRLIQPTTRTLSVPRGSLKGGVYSLKFPGQPAVRIEFR